MTPDGTLIYIGALAPTQAIYPFDTATTRSGRRSPPLRTMSGTRPCSNNAFAYFPLGRATTWASSTQQPMCLTLSALGCGQRRVPGHHTATGAGSTAHGRHRTRSGGSGYDDQRHRNHRSPPEQHRTPSRSMTTADGNWAYVGDSESGPHLQDRHLDHTPVATVTMPAAQTGGYVFSIDATTANVYAGAPELGRAVRHQRGQQHRYPHSPHDGPIPPSHSASHQQQRDLRIYDPTAPTRLRSPTPRLDPDQHLPHSAPYRARRGDAQRSGLVRRGQHQRDHHRHQHVHERGPAHHRGFRCLDRTGCSGSTSQAGPPTPTTKITVPKLFIPRKGLGTYDESDFGIDWRHIELWANSWTSGLFIPGKPAGRVPTVSELNQNWLTLEVWADTVAKNTMTAGNIGSSWTPLFIPRKNSDQPQDLDVNFLRIENWANSL